MPIKGLSDRYRMPVIGTIHIGTKKVEGEYPKKLDYFRFPEGVEHPFGEKPKEIEIIFPKNDRLWCCDMWYKRWGGSRDSTKAILMCFGDGETATETDPQTGEMSRIECLGKDCPYYEEKKCIQQVNLSFLLPTVPGLGIWRISSKGINTMLNVNSMLLTFENMNQSFAGIPFKLSVRPQTAKVEGKPVTIYALHLSQDKVSFADLMHGERRALPAPETLDGLEEERPDDLVAKRNRSGNEAPEANEQKVARDRGEVAEQAKKTATAVKERPHKKPLF